jgi:beta-glucosidase
VVYVPGASFTEEVDIEAAVREARAADAAILFLGEQASTETPGDIEDLELPAAQRRLANAIAATGTPVVIVLIENRPLIVSDVVAGARAVVLAYQPGPHGGEAIADVLFGEVNPSGRLPFTYPRHGGSLIHYDRTNSELQGPGMTDGRVQPQWEFGHGLSYTRFDHADLRLARAELTATDTLALSVSVSNLGERAGKEVVQVYVRDLYASIAPPVRRLRAFRKLELQPGQQRTVAFRIPVSELAFVGRDGAWVVEPGEFEVVVGDEVARFTVR